MEAESINLGNGVNGAACPAGMDRLVWCPADYDFDPLKVLYKVCVFLILSFPLLL
jgi:hypothetical protein